LVPADQGASALRIGIGSDQPLNFMGDGREVFGQGDIRRSPW
jgi:Na+-translocating ferredoxin:NAD+ oxidoreductase RnfE subunit